MKWLIGIAGCNGSAGATSVIMSGGVRASKVLVKNDMIDHIYSPWTTAPVFPFFMSHTNGSRHIRNMLRR